jgi:hypothetical protein
MRELRREAQRRIDARYDQVDLENERLRRQLADYLATNPTAGAPSPADARPGHEDADPRAT